MNEFAPHLPETPDASDGIDTAPVEVSEGKNEVVEVKSELKQPQKIDTGKLVLPPEFNEGKNFMDKDADNDKGKMPV